MSNDNLIAIIGLGNPGAEHAHQRHNAGWWMVDALVDAQRGSFRREAKFHGDLARISLSGQDMLVLKPGTYMNRSGLATQALAQFYKLTPDKILAVHDELDLAAGVARLKLGGGHGGHNGLRDLHRVFGDGYRRLRVGIGHPGQKDLVLNYVLGHPSKADEKLIMDSIIASLTALPLWWTQSWDKAVQKLHSDKTDKTTEK